VGAASLLLTIFVMLVISAAILAVGAIRARLALRKLRNLKVTYVQVKR